MLVALCARAPGSQSKPSNKGWHRHHQPTGLIGSGPGPQGLAHGGHLGSS